MLEILKEITEIYFYCNINKCRYNSLTVYTISQSMHLREWQNIISWQQTMKQYGYCHLHRDFFLFCPQRYNQICFRIVLITLLLSKNNSKVDILEPLNDVYASSIESYKRYSIILKQYLPNYCIIILIISLVLLWNNIFRY